MYFNAIAFFAILGVAVAEITDAETLFFLGSFKFVANYGKPCFDQCSSTGQFEAAIASGDYTSFVGCVGDCSTMLDSYITDMGITLSQLKTYAAAGLKAIYNGGCILGDIVYGAGGCSERPTTGADCYFLTCATNAVQAYTGTKCASGIPLFQVMYGHRMNQVCGTAGFGGFGNWGLGKNGWNWGGNGLGYGQGFLI